MTTTTTTTMTNLLTVNDLFAAHEAWSLDQGVTVSPDALGSKEKLNGWCQETGLDEEYLMAFLIVHDMCHHLMLPMLNNSAPVGIDDEAQAIVFGSAVSASLTGNAFDLWSDRFTAQFGWAPLNRLHISGLYLGVIRRIANELGLDADVLLDVAENM